MRMCTSEERRNLNIILENNLEELSVIKKVIHKPQLMDSINWDKVIVYDRIIGELLAEYIDDNTIIGMAYMLGMMQGKNLAQKKNSDWRTTANRSI